MKALYKLGIFYKCLHAHKVPFCYWFLTEDNGRFFATPAKLQGCPSLTSPVNLSAVMDPIPFLSLQLPVLSYPVLLLLLHWLHFPLHTTNTTTQNNSKNNHYLYMFPTQQAFTNVLTHSGMVPIALPGPYWPISPLYDPTCGTCPLVYISEYTGIIHSIHLA